MGRGPAEVPRLLGRQSQHVRLCVQPRRRSVPVRQRSRARHRAHVVPPGAHRASRSQRRLRLSRRLWKVSDVLHRLAARRARRRPGIAGRRGDLSELCVSGGVLRQPAGSRLVARAHSLHGAHAERGHVHRTPRFPRDRARRAAERDRPRGGPRRHAVFLHRRPQYRWRRLPAPVHGRAAVAARPDRPPCRGAAGPASVELGLGGHRACQGDDGRDCLWRRAREAGAQHERGGDRPRARALRAAAARARARAPRCSLPWRPTRAPKYAPP